MTVRTGSFSCNARLCRRATHDRRYVPLSSRKEDRCAMNAWDSFLRDLCHEGSDPNDFILKAAGDSGRSNMPD